MPENNENESRPEPWRRLRPHVAVEDLGGRLLSAALVIGVAVVGALVLAPGAVHRLPGPDSLGLPAPAVIKADRDYEIVDAEATARRRAEAAAAERPVYDQDEGAADEAAARVRAAFALMRETGAHHDRFVSQLQVVVREDDFEALAHAGFSEEVEADLVALARIGLAGRVVADRQLLPAGREGSTAGFAVRSFRAGVLLGEEVAADGAAVRVLDEARAEIFHEAPRRLAARHHALRGSVTRLAAALVRPTLVLNHGETTRRRSEAAARVKPVGISIKRGERIIGDGERIEERHLVVFEGIRAQTRNEHRVPVRVGGGLLVALVSVLLWLFARRNLPGFRPARKDALLLATLLVGTLVLGALGLAVADGLHERFRELPRPSLQHFVPFAAGAMIVRLVLSGETAFLFAVASGICAGLLAGQSLGFGLFATFTGLAAAGLVGGSRDRAGLFRAGALVGAVGAAVAIASLLLAGRGAAEIVVSATAALVGGTILLPVVVVGVLPLVEGVFGYVTDVKLLELANLNHPALKELILQAPGTYHHSILMGSMVEAAAQAIGANPLLAKVSAYYHDLGKIRNPLYFAENQRGENRHDELAPSMSALIIKRHVTDGLELAEHWKLPRVVSDAIAQHHGCRLVGYFWAKCRNGEDAAAPAATDEEVFRYAGPKPQTREAALVMIADSCEASARALPEPTPEALAAVVSKRMNEVFSEGQLDECELTLRDLNAIAGAMVRALEAIYHSRPEYPGVPRAEPAPGLHVVGRR
ncbi:MAG TPA: HDIG domain-containing protein [Anaeromyxobacteraceae bacterium]|nr:HDIG domain-containing protein [Anaeromyxobacteraceae bacterium]